MGLSGWIHFTDAFANNYEFIVYVVADGVLLFVADAMYQIRSYYLCESVFLVFFGQL